MRAIRRYSNTRSYLVDYLVFLYFYTALLYIIIRYQILVLADLSTKSLVRVLSMRLFIQLSVFGNNNIRYQIPVATIDTSEYL